MSIVNVVIMTVKGRSDLTWQCLSSLCETLDVPARLVLVEATAPDSSEYIGSIKFLDFCWKHTQYLESSHNAVFGCGISEGWNCGIASLAVTYPAMGAEGVFVWLLNNDVIFKKSGWLQELSNRLRVPGTGLVGSSAMSVFGHPFATGGIWGFNLATALSIAEDGKILDEKFNYSCQDVDLSIRMAKAGYVVTHVPGVELGDDPMMVHLVSQTVYSNEGEQTVLEKRKPEFEYLIQKHGRRE